MSEKNIQPVQHSVLSLVLGICSIVLGCLFVGLVCGIVCLSITGKSYREYKNNPDLYVGGGMLVAGRVLSIIGIVLGGFYLLYYIFLLAVAGSFFVPYFELFN